MEPKPGQTMAAAAKEAKQRMPWMPVVANETWLQRTKADAQQTFRDGLCSGRGIFSVQVRLGLGLGVRVRVRVGVRVRVRVRVGLGVRVRVRVSP